MTKPKIPWNQYRCRMDVNVESRWRADKREELRLETIRFMRRIRAAISAIASREVTRWIHANETKLSRARKQLLLFAAARQETFGVRERKESTASRRDAEFVDQPLRQRLDVGPRGIFLS